MFCSLLEMLVSPIHNFGKNMCTVCNACNNEALVASPHVNILRTLVFKCRIAFINILSLEETNFMIANACHN